MCVRERDRQTDRQTDRQAGRQADRQTDRQTETETQRDGANKEASGCGISFLKTASATEVLRQSTRN